MSFRTVYGYSHSENGWRMCDRNECDIVRIPNLFLVDTAPLRKGATHTILGAWLKWYDTNVEEILSPTWGWSNTNDVANSNHLSGTAVDVNATKYPWGLRTMPASRIVKIREGLRLFEGTVFWGADWGRADEMHYQMAFREGDARNESFAAKLRGGHLGIYGTAPVAPPAVPVRNAIDDVAAMSVWLGKRLHAGERDAVDGGKYADFEHGSIYWHPNVGAFAVPALVYEVWKRNKWEQGFLGYPREAHKVHDGAGDVQEFQGGTIARRYGTDGFVCHGVIGRRWVEEGGVRGVDGKPTVLGWPTSDEYDTADGGRRQDFERGSLVWHPSGAIQIVGGK